MYILPFYLAGVEGLEPPAPGFGELLDNLSSFNSLNTLCKYIGLRYPWVRYSQRIPACVSFFVPFFVPRFAPERFMKMRLLIAATMLLTACSTAYGKSEFKNSGERVVSTLYCEYRPKFPVKGFYHFNAFIFELTDIEWTNKSDEKGTDVFWAWQYWIRDSRKTGEYWIYEGYKYFYREPNYVHAIEGLGMFSDSRIRINRETLETVITDYESVRRKYECDLIAIKNRAEAFERLENLRQKYQNKREKKKEKLKI